MGRVIDCKKYDIYKGNGTIHVFGLLCVAITEIETCSSYSFSLKNIDICYNNSLVLQKEK
jgi:hypothetical protein